MMIEDGGERYHMGIRINFDDDMVRDVKDIQAAILIQQVLIILEIQFQRIVIEPTEFEEDHVDIVGLSDEELRRWR